MKINDVNFWQKVVNYNVNFHVILKKLSKAPTTTTYTKQDACDARPWTVFYNNNL